MNLRKTALDRLRDGLVVARGFAIAAAGGTLFHWLHFPAAWVAGGTVAVALAALIRVDVVLPRRLRDVIFVLLGISMGSGVTPETIERLPQWPISLAFVALSVVGVTGFTYLFFRHVAKWDWRTALTAAPRSARPTGSRPSARGRARSRR